MANPDNVEPDIKENFEDVELGRMANEPFIVQYKDMCATFKMTTEGAKLWMQSFQVYFDNIKADKCDIQHGGVMFSTIDWKLPGNEENYGSLHLIIWTSTKSPSVSVQGSHYL